MTREAASPSSCPRCKSAHLIRVGLLRELTFFRCGECDEVFLVPSDVRARDRYVVPSQKSKRPKRDTAPHSAFQALQHVIETAEGKKPAPKRRPH